MYMSRVRPMLQKKYTIWYDRFASHIWEL